MTVVCLEVHLKYVEVAADALNQQPCYNVLFVLRHPNHTHTPKHENTVETVGVHSSPALF